MELSNLVFSVLTCGITKHCEYEPVEWLSTVVYLENKAWSSEIFPNLEMAEISTLKIAGLKNNVFFFRQIWRQFDELWNQFEELF